LDQGRSSNEIARTLLGRMASVDLVANNSNKIASRAIVTATPGSFIENTKRPTTSL
jgi:hypothetical protein